MTIVSVSKARNSLGACLADWDYVTSRIRAVGEDDVWMEKRIAEQAQAVLVWLVQMCN